MNIEQIDSILSKIKIGPSKWELDNIVYHDRTSNPETLFKFLSRIKELTLISEKNEKEQQEYSFLLELLEDLDEEDISDFYSRSEDEDRENFIEELARVSAIQVLTNGRMDFELMNTACKLSPTDFILCAKRTQELINAIRSLVIKGETLSQDIAQS